MVSRRSSQLPSMLPNLAGRTKADRNCKFKYAEGTARLDGVNTCADEPEEVFDDSKLKSILR